VIFTLFFVFSPILLLLLLLGLLVIEMAIFPKHYLKRNNICIQHGI